MLVTNEFLTVTLIDAFVVLDSLSKKASKSDGCRRVGWEDLKIQEQNIRVITSNVVKIF